ncbi:MAG: hypothetical protein SFY66_05890 [Oculatellaceae cyanobacterium bins.114]|nr:hypothetical protein [Oculatellaceae cyanobacterium bins.114]
MVQTGSSEFWQEIINRFVELSDPTKVVYARALLASLGDYALDENVERQLIPTTTNSILTPYDIEERYGINLKDQDAYGISLRKRKVIEFLKEQGRSVNPKTDLKESKYQVLGSKPAILGNASIFTYAEALYMTSHRRPIAVPQVLKDYLNESL